MKKSCFKYILFCFLLFVSGIGICAQGVKSIRISSSLLDNKETGPIYSVLVEYKFRIYQKRIYLNPKYNIDKTRLIAYKYKGKIYKMDELGNPKNYKKDLGLVRVSGNVKTSYELVKRVNEYQIQSIFGVGEGIFGSNSIELDITEEHPNINTLKFDVSKVNNSGHIYSIEKIIKEKIKKDKELALEKEKQQKINNLYSKINNTDNLTERRNLYNKILELDSNDSKAKSALRDINFELAQINAFYGRVSSDNHGSNEKDDVSDINEEKQYRKEERQKKAKRNVKKETYNKKYLQYQKEKQRELERRAAYSTATASSSVAILSIFGKYIYSNMGPLNSTDVYKNKSSYHFGFDCGYGFSLVPIFFNSEKQGVNSLGNFYSDEETRSQYHWAFTFDVEMEHGYESKYFNASGYGGITVGWQIFDLDFLFAPHYGFKSSIGLKNIKYEISWEQYFRNYTSRRWLEVDEYGAGESKHSINRFKQGLLISFSDFERTHLSIGLVQDKFRVEEKYKEGLNGTISFYDLKDSESVVANLNTNQQNFNRNNIVAKGYYLGIVKDHSFRIQLEMFFNYPYSGRVNYNYSREIQKKLRDNELNNFMFQLKVLRCIDVFK